MKIHKPVFFFVILFSAGLLLSGCRFPTELFFAPDLPPPSQIEPPQPTATASITDFPTGDQTPSSTPPPCAYAQAEQDLPDITARVQDQLNKDGLGSVEALAVAFGENCVDTLNNKILSFSAIETDFFYTLVVADTDNKDELGNWTLRLLAVTQKFPPEETPGPNQGYLTIVFQDSQKDARLRVRLDDAIQAKEDGLIGAQFYTVLNGE